MKARARFRRASLRSRALLALVCGLAGGAVAWACTNDASFVRTKTDGEPAGIISRAEIGRSIAVNVILPVYEEFQCQRQYACRSAPTNTTVNARPRGLRRLGRPSRRQR